MKTHFFVLNAGSSSLKFALFGADGEAPAALARGNVDGLGTAPHFVLTGDDGRKLEDRPVPKNGTHAHEFALRHVLDTLRTHFPSLNVKAVGHRFVHGGPRYAEPMVLTEAVFAELKEFIPLAPLHQPHNLAGVAAAHAAFPDAVQIACFDTAFHRAHPWVNDTFALPRKYYDLGIRRYGFHGISYEYISGKLREIAPETAAGRVVVAHLGAGASMCAIKNGISVASTMGFSPLDGLPMGTRCGQLDPAVVFYLHDQQGMSIMQIREMLYKDSGLKGLSGLSGDMRELEAAGTPEAEQAIDYFVFRIRRELGGLAAAVSGLDAMVFCGGIGENAARIRSRICEDLHWIGLDVDEERNARNETVISTATSRAKIFVIPTDEAAMIAKHIQEIYRRG